MVGGYTIPTYLYKIFPEPQIVTNYMQINTVELEHVRESSSFYPPAKGQPFLIVFKKTLIIFDICWQG